MDPRQQILLWDIMGRKLIIMVGYFQYTQKFIEWNIT